MDGIVTGEIVVTFIEKDAGHCQNTGAKLDMIGQIHHFKNYKSIGVVRGILPDGEVEINFIEADTENVDVIQVTDKQDYKELSAIWHNASFERVVVNTIESVMANGGIEKLLKSRKGDLN